MTILELLQAYWKEGLLYLILGAGIIQITPIKINPFSWLAKKIGNALNADVLEKLKNSDKLIAELDKKLDNHISESEKEQMDDCRRRILNFNEKILSNDSHISKERYDGILDDIDRYEKYCASHPEYPNAKAVLSIKNLKEDYLKRY